MVRHWISLMMQYRAVVHDGLGHAVGHSLVVFYVECGLLGYQYMEWLQGALNFLVGLFRQMDLVAMSYVLFFSSILVMTGLIIL